MAELVQVAGAVSLVPLMGLTVLAWGQALFGRPKSKRRSDEVQGAALWTVPTLAVSAILLGGWFVPRALTVGLMATGLIAGAVLATKIVRRPQRG